MYNRVQDKNLLIQSSTKADKMKVKNIVNNNGNTVPNQFIISDGGRDIFQSYKTIIAIVSVNDIVLDTGALDYSRTTCKYLYQFLGKDRKTILNFIENGAITLKDLN